MSCVSGWVTKKGWFSAWKPRLLKCDGKTISLHKKESETPTKRVYRVHGCSVKELSVDSYDRQYVFALKFDDEKLILSANDSDGYSEWVKYFRQFAKRPSMCVRKSLQLSDGCESLSCEAAPESHTFDIDRLVCTIDNAARVSHGSQALFALADLCSEFMSSVRRHIDSCIGNGPASSLTGISVRVIEDNERVACMNLVKGSAMILTRQLDGIYCPLHCIVDAIDGKSYFASTTIETSGKTRFSASAYAKMRLFSLAFGITRTKALKFQQDGNGNLWVLDPSLVAISEVDVVPERVSNLNKFHIFDSVTLADAMIESGVRVSHLRDVYLAFPELKNLCMCEMVARCCKRSFAEHIRAKQAPADFLNLVVGNGSASAKLWGKLDENIESKFDTKVPRDLPRGPLLSSLLFHLGISVGDKIDFDFDKVCPIGASDVVCVEDVVHHRLLNVCREFKNKRHYPKELIREQQYGRAIKLLNKRIALRQTIYGEQSSHVLLDLALLSLSHDMSGDCETARMCFASLSSEKNTIAHVLASRVECVEVLSTVSHGRRVIQSLFGSGSSMESYFLSLMAQSVKKTDATLAMNLACEAVNVQGNEDALVTKAIIAHESGDATTAFNCLKAVDDPTSSLFYFTFSDILLGSSDFLSALPYAIRAYSMRVTLSNHEAVLFESVQQVAILYECLSRPKVAISFYKKLREYIVTIKGGADVEEIVVTQNIVRAHLVHQGIDTVGVDVPVVTDSDFAQMKDELLSGDPITYAENHKQQIGALVKFISTPADNLLHVSSNARAA